MSHHHAPHHAAHHAPPASHPRTIVQSLLAALMLVGWARIAGAEPMAIRGAATMSISGVSYLIDYPARGCPASLADVVQVWRGIDADIRVSGQFLNLSTGVEVVKSGDQQAASGISANIIERQGGSNTNIVIRVSTTSAVEIGFIYNIRIHYAVETNGPDCFTVIVGVRGRIDAMSIAGGRLHGSVVSRTDADPANLTVDGYYTLVVGGDVSGDRNVIASRVPSGCKLDMIPDSSSSTTSRYSVHCTGAGAWDLKAGDFLADENSGLSSSAQATLCSTKCAAGIGSISLRWLVKPAVTDMSPNAVPSSAPVTIQGTNLNPAGGTPTLRFVRKYVSPGQPRDQSIPINGTNISLTFLAPQNVRADTLLLDYPSAPFIRHPVRLPPLNVLEPPAIDGITRKLTALNGAKFSLVLAGNDTIIGKNLGTPLVGLPLATRSGSLSPILGSMVTTSGSSRGTATFDGNALTVQSVRYDGQRAQSDGTIGADIMVVVPPNMVSTRVGSLVVTTPSGSATLLNALFTRPPTIGTIKQLLPTGALRDITGLTLIRGSDYVLSGEFLNVVASGAVVQVGILRLNGAAIPNPTPTGPLPASALRFTVPTTAANGALTLETIAGLVTVGTFTIVNP